VRIDAARFPCRAMSLRPFLRLFGALLLAGAVCAVPAVARLDDPDTTPPVITVTFPTEGQEITSDQGALPTQFACVDPVVPGAITSGTATCDGDATIDTTKNGDQQFIVTTTDNAGKGTQKIVNYRLVDRTPPTITITSPTEGMHVGLHSSHNASFSCADAGGSLIDTCEGNQNIDSPTPGPHVFTVLAIDGDGNRTTKSVNYIVDSTEENVVHNPAGAEAAAEKALSASGAALKNLRKKRTATLAFNAGSQMKVSVKVTAKVKGKTVTIATASGTAGGDGIKLKLKASGAGASALKRKGKLALKISVTIDDPNGNASVTKSKSVTTRR
jgi:hypothetical protein